MSFAWLNFIFEQMRYHEFKLSPFSGLKHP